VTVCTGPLGALVVEELDSDEAGLGAAGFGVDVAFVVEVMEFTWLFGFVLLKES